MLAAHFVQNSVSRILGEKSPVGLFLSRAGATAISFVKTLKLAHFVRDAIGDVVQATLGNCNQKG